MAVETGAADIHGPAEIIQSLPPDWQVVVLAFAGVGIVGIMGWRFLSTLKSEAPEVKELAVADTATFADMGPVRELVTAVRDLALQQARTSAAIESSAEVYKAIADQLGAQVGRTADLVGQLILDLRAEREERERDEEIEAEVERRLAARARALGRARAARKPAAKKD